MLLIFLRYKHRLFQVHSDYRNAIFKQKYSVFIETNGNSLKSVKMEEK